MNRADGRRRATTCQKWRTTQEPLGSASRGEPRLRFRLALAKNCHCRGFCGVVFFDGYISITLRFRAGVMPSQWSGPLVIFCVKVQCKIFGLIYDFYIGEFISVKPRRTIKVTWFLTLRMVLKRIPRAKILLPASPLRGFLLPYEGTCTVFFRWQQSPQVCLVA